MLSRKKRLAKFFRPFVLVLPLILFSVIALILGHSNVPDLSLRPTDTVYLVSNSKAETELSHEVRFSPEPYENGERLVMDAALNLTVRGPFKDTIKILIPFKAQVLSKSVRREETLLGMHAFVTELDLKDSEARTLRFRYRLIHPNRRYLLRVSPGQFHVKYSVKAQFPDFLEAKIKNFAGTLTSPRFFRVRFEKVTSPLRFVKGEIANLSQIRLEFNRTLNRQDAQDILNFSLEDVNETYREVKDRLFITSSTVQGNTLLLRVRGMTRQPGEIYRLSVANMRDRSGNSLKSLPFAATFVQPMLY